MRGKKFITGMVLAFVASLCMATHSKGEVKPASMDCAAKVSFEMETGKAEMTVFKCYMKAYEGKEAPWYEFGLKNVSDKPARFLIRVISEDGPAFSGLVPSTGKPKDFPLLAPGAELAGKYPMNMLKEVPSRLTVVVEEAVQ